MKTLFKQKNQNEINGNSDDNQITDSKVIKMPRIDQIESYDYNMSPHKIIKQNDEKLGQKIKDNLP